MWRVPSVSASVLRIRSTFLVARSVTTARTPSTTIMAAPIIPAPIIPAPIIPEARERALASVRVVKEVRAIAGAERVEALLIGAWTVLGAKGAFKAGNRVVFFEIDSLVPKLPCFAHLPGWKKTFLGAGAGVERLHLKSKLFKSLGVLSQGLVCHLSEAGVPEDAAPGTDVTAVVGGVGVAKYEVPGEYVNASMAGAFPAFLRKTDQERVQNVFDAWKEAHAGARLEVTLKLDGSSCSVYYDPDRAATGERAAGVCSRNVDLKLDAGGAFIDVGAPLLQRLRAFLDHTRDASRGATWADRVRSFAADAAAAGEAPGGGGAVALPALSEAELASIAPRAALALQGELMGPGVNGNRERLAACAFFCFDIFDIAAGTYLPPAERRALARLLRVAHVPVVDADKAFADFASAADVLAYANRPSMHNAVAEGVVFKTADGRHSFKAVSNAYLLQSN